MVTRVLNRFGEVVLLFRTATISESGDLNPWAILYQLRHVCTGAGIFLTFFRCFIYDWACGWRKIAQFMCIF